MGIRQKIYWPVVAAAVIVAAIYAAASAPNQFVYDDHEVIENQFPLRNFSDLAAIFREPHYLNYPYYRPITRSSFAIQMRIWGDDPRAYHLLNALLAGAALLGASVLVRRVLPTIGRRAALLAAACFCLHPAFSECVYPAASGRESLLPAVLMLFSTWAYMGKGVGNFAAAIGLWIAAVLCKEQAAVLPGIFLAADLLGISRWGKCDPGGAARSVESLEDNRRTRGYGEWLGRYGVMIAISAAYLLIRHAVFAGRGGAIHLAIVQHPIAPLWSMWYGVQTAIAPFLELRYEPALDVWFGVGRTLIAAIALLAIAILTWRGSANLRRAGMFWLTWLVLMQLPTAHLFQQEAAFSERYVALAILAFPAMIAGIAVEQIVKPRQLRFAGITAAWVAVGLGTITVLRSAYYFNDTAFSNQWAATNPNAAGAHVGLGFIAQQAGDNATAIDEYRRALQLDDSYPAAHNNLANLLADINNIAAAQQEYDWLLRYNPRDAIAMVNDAEMLSNVAFYWKDPAYRRRAKQLLDQALVIRPEYAQAHFAMAVWQEIFGSRTEAILQLKQAIALRPNYPEAIDRLKHLSKTTTAASSEPTSQAATR